MAAAPSPRPPQLNPTAFTWAADGELVVLAGPSESAADEDEAADRSWWHIRGGDEPQHLADGGNGVPQALIREQGRRSFVGLADGKIRRLSLENGQWTDLIANVEPKVSSIVWPEAGADDEAARLVLAVERDGSSEWLSLDLRSGELSAFERPAPQASIANLVPEHDTAVLSCSDRDGDRMWLARPAHGRGRPIVERNRWLSAVEEGELRRIAYRSLDGDELKGWLMLPVGYEEGARYPLVVEVYPGIVFQREQPSAPLFSINGHHCLNPQLLAAQGFAVLFPSIRSSPKARRATPTLSSPKECCRRSTKRSGSRSPIRRGSV